MQRFIQKFWHRLKLGFGTIPRASDWLYAAVILLLLATISLSIGFLLGFIQFQVIQPSWFLIPRAFVSPAIGEELLFRVLLLPHPTENVPLERKWLWGCISLGLFIVWHPVEGLFVLAESPIVFATFTNPVFLLLATFLGVACTLSYLQSGSAWTPVVIHWIFVIVWLVLLDGHSKVPV